MKYPNEKNKMTEIKGINAVKLGRLLQRMIENIGIAKKTCQAHAQALSVRPKTTNITIVNKMNKTFNIDFKRFLPLIWKLNWISFHKIPKHKGSINPTKPINALS